VPVPIPVSDCYCDDCASKCADFYHSAMKESPCAQS
jgi:hypothetical protein